MKAPRSLLLSAAGFACGICVTAWYFQRQGHTAPAAAADPAVALARSAPAPVKSVSAPEHSAGTAVQMRPAPETPPVVPPSGVELPADNLAPENLAERAARVEAQANRELERLIPLLGLSEDQQDRVFARLAQGSADWTPGLGIVAGPSGSVSAAPGVLAAPGTGSTVPDILLATDDPILDPAQEYTLAQDELDRREWWDEVLTNIQGDMEAGTAAAVTEEPPPETKTEDTSDVIVD